MPHHDAVSHLVNRSHLSDIETPAVLVDRERLIANLDSMQALAREHRVALRPHVKTHKCLEIAQLQLDRGAVGLTASKVDEALTFLNAGVKSITVAYPIIDERKLERLIDRAQNSKTDLRVIVDSETGISALSSVVARFDIAVGVFLKIDVGFERCGITENDARLIPLVRSICANRGLRFTGLLSHAGHAYSASNREEIARIAAEECQTLNRIRLRLQDSGFAVPEVSVGSTPTVLASESYEGITEIRPGNYVFMDRTPVRLGLIALDRVALTVLTTVVSTNERYLITDAGSKVLSSDLGAHGTGAGSGYGLAFPLAFDRDISEGLRVAKLSEEHGFVDRPTTEIPIGTKLRIVPNHSCAVVNLADDLIVVSGGKEVARWRVAARGQVR